MLKKSLLIVSLFAALGLRAQTAESTPQLSDPKDRTVPAEFEITCGEDLKRATEGALVLTLENALEIAMSENPTIRIADQEIEIKKYAKKGTYASLYPNLSATGQYQRVIKKQTMSMDFNGTQQTIKVGSDNSFTGGLQAQMPLIDASLWTKLKVSALDVELAVEKARSSRIDMIEQVTKAYYTILLAKESFNVYRRVYDNAIENNLHVRKKYDVGSVSEYDMIRSNVSVQNAIPAVYDAENGIILALWQMKALLGLDLEKNIDVSGNLMDYAALMDQAYSIQGMDLKNNSSLKQLDIQEQQLEKAVKLQKMTNVPTLSINAAYLYTALGNDGKFFVRSAWNPYSYAGLQLNIPIFAGGAKRASTHQATLNLQNLQLQRENAERNLRVQVVQYLNSMQSNVKQYHSAAATVSQAERGYSIAAKRFEIGRGTQVEVDDNQLALTKSELQRNQAVFNFLNAKVGLDKVLGAYESTAENK